VLLTWDTLEQSRGNLLDVGDGIDLNSRLNSRRWLTYWESNTGDHGFEVARCIGEWHGTPRTSPSGAFYLLSALPRGLDLGTLPIDPLSDEHR
jgi:hypothetical protein